MDEDRDLPQEAKLELLELHANHPEWERYRDEMIRILQSTEEIDITLLKAYYQAKEKAKRAQGPERGEDV